MNRAQTLPSDPNARRMAVYMLQLAHDPEVGQEILDELHIQPTTLQQIDIALHSPQKRMRAIGDRAIRQLIDRVTDQLTEPYIQVRFN